MSYLYNYNNVNFEGNFESMFENLCTIELNIRKKYPLSNFFKKQNLEIESNRFKKYLLKKGFFIIKTKVLIAILGVVFLFHVILVIILGLSLGCDPVEESFPTAPFIVGFYIILVFFCVFLVYNANDNFKIRLELIFQIILWGILCIRVILGNIFDILKIYSSIGIMIVTIIAGPIILIWIIFNTYGNNRKFDKKKLASFSEALDNADYLQYFVGFMKKEFNMHHLTFSVLMHKWGIFKNEINSNSNETEKKNNNSEMYKSKEVFFNNMSILFIYNKTNNLNISGELKNQMESLLNSHNLDKKEKEGKKKEYYSQLEKKFTDIERTIYALINNDSYCRFSASKEYKKIIQVQQEIS